MKKRTATFIAGILTALVLTLNASAQDERSAIVKIYTVHNIPDYYNPWNMSGTRSSTGSGCVIKGNRILTNGHVVRDQTFVQVRRFGDSRRYQARVLFVSHQADLALLTVEDPAFFEGINPLVFGKLPDTQEEVDVYGFPMGGDTLSITKGVISRIEHQVYAHSSVALLAAQIDAAINPGNSGGPAIVDGKIVGVAMQGMTQADNIGYIVPAPVVKHFIQDISDGKRDGIPGLGINWQRMENPDLRRHYGLKTEQSGVLVTDISTGTAADGTLKKDDVLLSIKGHPIADDGTVEFRPMERTIFGLYIQENQLGESVSLEVLRDGKPITVSIKLAYPIEHSWLVPLQQYDILPTYYIYGGVVFVPLTKDLMQMWGPNWYSQAPRSFLVRLDSNLVTPETDEIVIALKVLAADVNQGYQNDGNWEIKSVDGQDVHNLKHLIELVEAGKGNEFVEFKSPGGNKIILDRNKVEKDMPAILSTYRIPHDRSADLAE